MNQEEDLKSQKNKAIRITIHKGPTPKFNDIENNLIEFIEFNRKLNNPVTTWCIANELFKYYPNLKNDNYLNITKWIYRFLERNNFTFRRSTVGQELPLNNINVASEFISSVFNSRYSMKYTEDLIANMDETPLCINMAPNYSISRKGKRTVKIRSQSRDKCHVSVILTIIANGCKLPPYLIFKGKPNGKIIRELNNNIYVKNKKIFVNCNENAWCTKDIMNKWINCISVFHVCGINSDNHEK